MEGTDTTEMDAFTTLTAGKLFVAVGLILLGAAIYSTVYYSIFCLTEVIAAALVVIWGICLLMRGAKMKKSLPDEENEDQSSSPFYYELEPVAFRRELPPIPRDIGREYDPVVLDKV